MTLPADTMNALLDWQARGQHPSELGSFVRALLTNDLRSAVNCADEANLAALPGLVRWVYWNVASGTYGSIEALVANHERMRRTVAA